MQVRPRLSHQFVSKAYTLGRQTLDEAGPTTRKPTAIVEGETFSISSARDGGLSMTLIDPKLGKGEGEVLNIRAQDDGSLAVTQTTSGADTTGLESVSKPGSTVQEFRDRDDTLVRTVDLGQGKLAVKQYTSAPASLLMMDGELYGNLS